MVKLIKNVIAMMVISVIFSMVAISNVNAEQGFYGIVYTNTSSSGGTYIPDSVISGAIVRADALVGSFDEDTTASACGYYTINVDSPGWYYLNVENDSYQTRLIPCGNVNTISSQRGSDQDLEYVGSGSWTRKDIHIPW